MIQINDRINNDNDCQSASHDNDDISQIAASPGPKAGLVKPEGQACGGSAEGEDAAEDVDQLGAGWWEETSELVCV